MRGAGAAGRLRIGLGRGRRDGVGGRAGGGFVLLPSEEGGNLLPPITCLSLFVTGYAWRIVGRDSLAIGDDGCLGVAALTILGRCGILRR